MSILVTGAAGYIGSHLMERLEQIGVNALGIDDFSSAISKTHGRRLKETTRKISVLNEKELQRVFEENQFSAVVHLAAIKAVDLSIAKSQYSLVNVEGTKILANLAREFGVKSFIFASTAAVYGDNCPLGGFHEEMELNPQSSYGNSKAFAEEILNNRAINGDFGLLIFRFFNVAGCMKDGKIETQVTNLIPAIFQNQKEFRPTLIFGNDYLTKDGTCVRDYIHVSDIVDAIIKGLKYLESNHLERVVKVNLGSRSGHSVMDVIKTVEEVLGEEVNYTIAPRRAGDSAISIANTDLARKVFGIESKKTLYNIVSDHHSRWKVM